MCVCVCLQRIHVSRYVISLKKFPRGLLRRWNVYFMLVEIKGLTEVSGYQLLTVGVHTYIHNPWSLLLMMKVGKRCGFKGRVKTCNKDLKVFSVHNKCLTLFRQ